MPRTALVVSVQRDFATRAENASLPFSSALARTLVTSEPGCSFTSWMHSLQFRLFVLCKPFGATIPVPPGTCMFLNVVEVAIPGQGDFILRPDLLWRFA